MIEVEFTTRDILVAWDDNRLWAIHEPTFEVAEVARTSYPDHDLSRALRVLARHFGPAPIPTAASLSGGPMAQPMKDHRQASPHYGGCAIHKGIILELSPEQIEQLEKESQDRGPDIDDRGDGYWWHGGKSHKRWRLWQQSKAAHKRRRES